MKSTSVTVSLPSDVAEAFRNASPAKRKQIQHLIEDALMPLQEMDEEARTERLIAEAKAEQVAGLTRQEAVAELERLMDEMGRQAQENGLTPDRLDALLNDDA